MVGLRWADGAVRRGGPHYGSLSSFWHNGWAGDTFSAWRRQRAVGTRDAKVGKEQVDVSSHSTDQVPRRMRASDAGISSTPLWEEVESYRIDTDLAGETPRPHARGLRGELPESDVTPSPI